MSGVWTKGPWRTGPINYADVYGSDGEIVALVPKGFDATVVNARLIAAAPELFASLEAIYEQARSWHEFHHGSECVQCDGICEELPRMKSALAKARGES